MVLENCLSLLHGVFPLFKKIKMHSMPCLWSEMEITTFYEINLKTLITKKEKRIAVRNLTIEKRMDLTKESFTQLNLSLFPCSGSMIKKEGLSVSKGPLGC